MHQDFCRGIELESDPAFLAWIDEWIAGQVTMEVVRKRSHREKHLVEIIKKFPDLPPWQRERQIGALHLRSSTRVIPRNLRT